MNGNSTFRKSVVNEKYQNVLVSERVQASQESMFFGNGKLAPANSAKAK
jgi:hypothetical protein